MKLIYICDDKRHLICVPYSIENLHQMAIELGISKAWWHKKDSLNHYDIPKRRIKEITNQCTIVSTRDIILIIKDQSNIDI